MSGLSRIWGGAALALCMAVFAGAPASAQSSMSISMGRAVNGALAQGDATLPSGEFVDRYTFQGQAGQHVVITLQSTAFDSYLIFSGPNGFQQDNDDDPAGGINSKVDVTLPSTGTYTIGATSFSSGSSGAYTLRVDGAGGQAPAQQQQASSTSGGGATLSPGRAINGALAQGDATLSSGEFQDSYSFQGQQGQTVTISMQSSAFDTYLILTGPNNYQEDNDDAEGGNDGTNSRIVATLPATGTYHIAATSYAANTTGAYQVLLENGATAPQQTADIHDGNGAPLVPGQPRSGALEQGDSTLQSGEFVDSYRFLGQRGQHVVIDLTSGQLDPYLIVTTPSGQQQDNDDGEGQGTNSRIDMVLTEDGEYGVHATTYQSGETGSYQVAVNVMGEGERTVAQAQQASSSGNAGVGQTINGALQNGDATLSSGEFTDTYQFQGRRGQNVSFMLNSSAFDPYLIVTSPSGQQQDNDDASSNDRNSRIDMTLPEDGTYNITATSYASGETGAYTLRINAGSAQASTGNTRPSTGGGRVQVHAIMVGISDYSGIANSLAYTAEDATNLAQTLRSEGVLSADSVVLTDGEATRANVRAAFQRVAANAGPNDLFLFFYSGHGSQSDEAPNSTEPDRKEEYIVLRDGLVQDDEVGQWFNAVHARVGIIALDSCFSGGFARDVVTRPGIMGLFSSEEDLTSAVAAKFQAGGYLSHFLRTGLGGEADDDHNLVITAGELSTYLWRKFATEVEDVQSVTMDHQTNYQRLVVDRGGVKIDDTVLALR